MNSRREQVWVGLFVLAAAALLIGSVLSVAGTFSRGNIPHRAYFKFAGGLEPGAAVRFGGMKAGSVQAVRVDPGDSTHIEVDFNVARDIPLKADSVARIASLGALGDNYVELTTGTRQAAAAAPEPAPTLEPPGYRDEQKRAVFGRVPRSLSRRLERAVVELREDIEDLTQEQLLAALLHQHVERFDAHDHRRVDQRRPRGHHDRSRTHRADLRRLLQYGGGRRGCALAAFHLRAGQR